MSNRKAALIIAMCVSAWPLLAADGILIVQKTTIGEKTSTHQIQIQDDKMRAESMGPNGAVEVMIFDGAKQVVWLLNYDKKTYTEMSKASMDNLGARSADMNARLAEMLKNMTPEQRAQMDAMMRGRGAAGIPGKPARTQYRKTGTDKVGRWPCDKYEGYQDSEKTTEVCTVDPTVLGLGLADLHITRQLSEFFQAVAPQNADSLLRIGVPEQGDFGGMPVRRVTIKGDLKTITEITEVSRHSFPASTFELPAGFTKQALGGRGGE